MRHQPFVALIAALAAATLPAQDSLQLADGRFVIGPKMTRQEDGIVVHFTNGDVKVMNDLVKTCTALGGNEQGNWTDEEREKLDRGLVPFEGKWIPVERRDKELAQRVSERAEKIAEAKKHRRWVDRYVTKTRNFEFHYTIDPDVMQAYMDLMETYFSEFTKEWGIRKPSKVGRLKVCFYHDKDYFHQVGGAPEGVIGYYRFVQPRELNFYYDRLDQDMTIDVMFHEANHYLTHLIDLDFHYPAWVNESLAEYYGASEWDEEKKEMKIGQLQEGRLAVIQDEIKTDDWQGLEDMIRLEQFNAVHYAWGWSFVHFLLQSEEYQKGFKKFYLGLARDNGVQRKPWFHTMKEVEADEQIRLLKGYLKIDDLKDLEKEWHEYVKGLESASDRGYLQAGQIALAHGMPIKAQRLFRTALDMGSRNPLTHYGYGRALEQKGKYQEALEQYDAAIALDPLEGMFYVRKAECLDHVDDDANKAEIARLFGLASEIEPDAYDVMLAKALWEHGSDD